MSGRIYGLMWLLLATAIAALYIGGGFNDRVITLVGFAVATLVFIGMAVVLPSSVNRESASEY